MPPVSVSISETLKDRLKEHCEETGVARSTLIAKLIEGYLDGDINLETNTVDAPEQTSEIERLQHEIAQKTRQIELFQQEALERDRQLITSSNDSEDFSDNPVVLANGSSIAQMLRERSKLYAMLSTQQQVIQLLKEEKSKVGEDSPSTSTPKVEEPEGRVIVWHPTSGVRLEMQLKKGLTSVPTSQAFGIIRSCVEVLEGEIANGDARNNIRDRILQQSEEELIKTSKDPNYKVEDNLYNEILDAVVQHI